MASDQHDVFLSHKSEYKPWVEWLGRALQARGHSVFLDNWHLVPGENWVEGLHHGLQQAKAAVLVATPEAVNSGWVRQEHASLMRRRQQDPQFKLVPVVFGAMPDLPFLSDIQCVDCRDPSQHRRWLYQVLCGLDGRSPGPDGQVDGPLEPPPAPTRQAVAAATVPAETQFAKRVMQQAHRLNCPPLMVTARGRRHQGPVVGLLKQQAKASYGAANTVHVVPPYAAQAQVSECFAEFGLRCGLAEPTPSAMAFAAASQRRIEQAGAWFVLLAGFENASAAFQHELAGCLREIAEQQPQGLRLVMVGGHRLVEQKFGAGQMSLLSHAQVLDWPDPGAADLLAWVAAEYPGLTLRLEQAQSMLEVTGQHAGLVRHCLDKMQDSGQADSETWAEWCLACPELWETWHALARSEPQALVEALARDGFGRPVAWPAQATSRRLLWADLLTERADQWRWRCPAVLRIGREVLAC